MQNDKNNQAKGCVHQPLQGKIAAHAAAGVIHGLRHEIQMSMPAQLNEAVAQIFPLQKHEKGENRHQSDRNRHPQHAADRVQPALTARNLPHRDRAIGR